MRGSILGIAASVLALASDLTVQATTIIPLRFDEVARRSAVVVEGTVVDLQVRSTGTDLQKSGAKLHRSPDAPFTPATPPRDAVDSTIPANAPQGLPVEGGKMLFTEVTLAVDRAVVGDPGPTLTFRVAGGDDGQVRVKVFGMPSFRMGERYVVFLRPGFEANAVPVVGVNQGFFRIVSDPVNGQVTLVNAENDVVTGVEEGRIISRRDLAKRGPVLGPPPSRVGGPTRPTELTGAVDRYWHSTEPPMSLDAFFAAVRAAREVQP